MRKVFYFLPLLFSFTLVNAQAGSPMPGFTSTPYNVAFGKDELWGMAIQPWNGKIVVAGRANYENSGLGTFVVARYNTDGSFDNSFGTNGIVTTDLTSGDDYAFTVVIQPDHKILVSGVAGVNGNDFAVVRYLNDGVNDGDLDPTFGTGGIKTIDIGKGAAINTDDHCQGMAYETSTNKIILGGYRNASGGGDFAIARINYDGSEDLSFSTDGKTTIDIANAAENVNGNEDFSANLIIQGTKYILSGSTGNGVQYDFALVRFNNDGSVDNTFGSNNNGVVISGLDEDDHAYSITTDALGNIIQAGYTSTFLHDPVNNDDKQRYDFAAMRFNANGIPDAGFGNYAPGQTRINVSGGVQDDRGRSVQVMTNGKILLAGSGSSDMAVVRLLADGTIDNSFGGGDGIAFGDPSGGQEDAAFVMRLNANNIYVAGYSRISGVGEVITLIDLQNDAVQAPLPLTLSQFIAQKQTSKVLLQWQTTMEENVKQFVIERSNDGKTYKAIGQVNATGNSNTLKNYTFADQSPFTSTSNYYRLLMQDADGHTKYSKVLIVKFDGQLTTNMQVFPSPVKSTLQVQLPAGLNGNTILQVIDISGRSLKTIRLTTDGNALNTSFDVNDLQTGVYILKAQAGNTTVTTRFTKQ
jgi:uncharacterized delta-60 repeat protein